MPTLFVGNDLQAQVLSGPIPEPPICSICLEQVWEGARTEYCHVFHNECISEWISRNARRPTCPNCVELCWPDTIDSDYAFIAFIGVVNDQGEPFALDQALVDIQNIQAEVVGLDEGDGEVQWVMNIPAPVEVLEEPEVQWVGDFPAVQAFHDGEEGQNDANAN